MRFPSKKASSLAYIDFTTHTDGAAEAWVDAEVVTQEQQVVIVEVGVEVGTATDELRARVTERQQADRAVKKARARFTVRDVMLCMQVNATSDGVLNGPALRSRKHPVYKHVFLGAMASEIVKGPLYEKPEVAARLRQRLGKVDDFPGRGALLSKLSDVVAKSVASRDALVAAETAAASAKDAERMARLTLRDTIEKGYGKLVAAFPGQRDFVETFFPKPQRNDSGEDEDETQAEAEAQAEAPPEAADAKPEGADR